MSQELYYTSAPRGLLAGSKGYCTVAATAGMSSVLRQKLEGLSILPGQSGAVLSHLLVASAGRNYHVLSRICPVEGEYSGRDNKFAHHLILETAELPAGGPAWLLQRAGVMQLAWDGQVRELPPNRPLPTGDQPAALCRTWQTVTGDAGWAGVLAEWMLQGNKSPAIILYGSNGDPLALFAEALALLPPKQRWQVTFSTHYSKALGAETCLWRGLPAASAEAKSFKRSAAGLFLDLTAPLGPAEGGLLVQGARTGKVPAKLEVPEPVGTPLPRPRSEAATFPTAAPAPVPWPGVQEGAKTSPARKTRDANQEVNAKKTPATKMPSPFGFLVGFIVALILAVGCFFLFPNILPGFWKKEKNISDLKKELDGKDDDLKDLRKKKNDLEEELKKQKENVNTLQNQLQGYNKLGPLAELAGKIKKVKDLNAKEKEIQELKEKIICLNNLINKKAKKENKLKEKQGIIKLTHAKFFDFSDHPGNASGNPVDCDLVEKDSKIKIILNNFESLENTTLKDYKTKNKISQGIALYKKSVGNFGENNYEFLIYYTNSVFKKINFSWPPSSKGQGNQKYRDALINSLVEVTNEKKEKRYYTFIDPRPKQLTQLQKYNFKDLFFDEKTHAVYTVFGKEKVRIDLLIIETKSK